MNIKQFLLEQNNIWTLDKSELTNYLNVISDKKRDIFDTLYSGILSNNLIKILEGPRRVGKSYLLKQLLSGLISAHNVSPKDTCTILFDTTKNIPGILTNIINEFLNSFSAENSTKYIFLDEVQYIDNWQDQIKYFYDKEYDIKFIITGSTSLFRGSKESLLGRFIKYELNTLNFREFINFRFNEKLSQFNIDTDTISKKEITNQINITLSKLLKYKNQFKTFLFEGQYPETALHQFSKKETIAYHKSIIDQLINYDVPYIYNKVNRVDFYNLVKVISSEIAGEFSVNNISKTMNISRYDITEYMKILEEIGYVKYSYNYKFKSMRQKVSGNKKIYNFNTNLALSINGFDETYLNDTRVFGLYFENYIFTRLYDHSFEKNIEYYKSDADEIDFVLQNHAIEVKSNDSPAIKNLDKYINISKDLNKPLIIVTPSLYETPTPDFQIIPGLLL